MSMPWLNWLLLITGFSLLCFLAPTADTWLREHNLGGWVFLIIVAGVVVAIYIWGDHDPGGLLKYAPQGTAREQDDENGEICSKGLPDDTEDWTKDQWDSHWKCLEGRGYHFPSREAGR